ncbi:hypothetical protein [Corynebacterium belfantii]|uniref:hypothetical protein n=1 Tax=Corynebacterium belfantii TaxID=2014537 RepID=UPI0018F0250E|nr:hypothetical protein [Corynebacterium belfantii]
MSQEGVEKRRVTTYDPIAVSDHSTVVAEYVAEGPTAEDYQSEAQLENELIRLLQSQAYEYLIIHNEQDLVANLRECPIVCVRGAWFTSSPRIGRGKPRLVG